MLFDIAASTYSGKIERELMIIIQDSYIRLMVLAVGCHGYK